ncbi:TetR family transcriptional regulator [Actinoplanes sp. ATCC 53533]|uniref:TetR/AcrR family transcriptional regulator n=1 Tax=Actinoplanes sp. ATCC 53533 TaxID=1288362 RepID=UPI000F7AA224|nr:TetR/AcrR family transcriptional regulator [Actinoplanes sp. ATCC 53533]RSM65184.1 TetR family transcriptional regulator [Actinoplanes sp. ATCC 53533]
MAKASYHHGDLRRALLDAAAAAIAEDGPAALSLRDLARRAGVSHAAPTHHFGDKKGLLTALAAEGFDRLAADLLATRAATGSFLELGVAYVRFATAHRAHFEVMWRPDLYHADDPALVAARDRSGDALYAGVADLPDGAGAADVREAGLAAWSLAHGFATLWLSDALPDMPEMPDEMARAVLRQLTTKPSRPKPRG